MVNTFHHVQDGPMLASTNGAPQAHDNATGTPPPMVAGDLGDPTIDGTTPVVQVRVTFALRHAGAVEICLPYTTLRDAIGTFGLDLLAICRRLYQEVDLDAAPRATEGVSMAAVRPSRAAAPTTARRDGHASAGAGQRRASVVLPPTSVSDSLSPDVAAPTEDPHAGLATPAVHGDQDAAREGEVRAGGSPDTATMLRPGDPFSPTQDAFAAMLAGYHAIQEADAQHGRIVRALLYYYVRRWDDQAGTRMIDAFTAADVQLATAIIQGYDPTAGKDANVAAAKAHRATFAARLGTADPADPATPADAIGAS